MTQSTERQLPVQSTSIPAVSVHVASDSDEDPLVGQLVDGRYLLQQKISSGAMGDVYAAVRPIMDKHVAVKLIKSELQPGEKNFFRYWREVKYAAEIDHPHVVECFDAGYWEDEHRAYLVMKLLDGMDLAGYLSKRPRLDEPTAVRLFQEICSGIAACHHAGIIHRDIKPANIYLTKAVSGELSASVIDLGLAKRVGKMAKQEEKQSEIGVICGTPAYMAPEQGTGHTTKASDIYSLGLVFREMLTGEKVAKDHHDQNAAPLPAHPDIRDALNKILHQALQPNPLKRFSSVTALMDAVGSATTGRPNGSSVDISDARRLRKPHIVLENPLCQVPIVYLKDGEQYRWLNLIIGRELWLHAAPGCRILRHGRSFQSLQLPRFEEATIDMYQRIPHDRKRVVASPGNHESGQREYKLNHRGKRLSISDQVPGTTILLSMYRADQALLVHWF